jgi:hypothetical protein
LINLFSKQGAIPASVWFRDKAAKLAALRTAPKRRGKKDGIILSKRTPVKWLLSRVLWRKQENDG